MLRRYLGCGTAAVLLWTTVVFAQSERPALSGRWEINTDLSAAIDRPPLPDDARSRGRMPPPGGGPGGGRFGGPGGGGFGGPGGGGFGRGRGSGDGPPRQKAEEMESGRALLDEVAQLPSRFTLIDKDDAVTFMEPDGVVRTYVANGKAEKHQLSYGVIETRTRWRDGTLEMELTVDRTTLVRTFTIRDSASRQLKVTTAFRGVPRDREVVTVYDESPSDRQ